MSLELTDDKSTVWTGIGLVPPGNKPSPEIILTEIYAAIWHHQCTLILPWNKRHNPVCSGPLQWGSEIFCDMIGGWHKFALTLQRRQNERDGVSNHRPHDCLLNRLFRRRSKKTCKLRVTGLCEGNSPVTGEFPAQRASDAENVSIWWRHHEQGQRSREQSISLLIC